MLAIEKQQEERKDTGTSQHPVHPEVAHMRYVWHSEEDEAGNVVAEMWGAKG